MRKSDVETITPFAHAFVHKVMILQIVQVPPEALSFWVAFKFYLASVRIRLREYLQNEALFLPIKFHLPTPRGHISCIETYHLLATLPCLSDLLATLNTLGLA